MSKSAIFVLAATFMAGCSNQAVQPQSGQAQYTPFVKVSDYSFEKINNPEVLLSKVASLGGEQKEFETNASYSDRMSKLKQFEVCKVFEKSKLKFDPVSGDYQFSEFLWDAQIANYRGEVNQTLSDHERFYPAMDLAFSSKKVGEYAAQNAFGATANVELREADSLHLVFKPIPKGPLFFPSPLIYVNSKALSNISGSFKLCVAAVPASPYYRLGKMYGQPTIQNPSAGEVRHHFIRADIARIRIADMQGNTLTEDAYFKTRSY